MTVWLTKAVAEAIAREGDNFYPLETGGLLLGWRDGEDRIVAGVTGPGPGAMHGRTAMIPDHRWQVARIHEAFRKSEGDLDYLGDWHTHPGGTASMSSTDVGTLRRIARKVSSPLMLIAAGGGGNWRNGCWLSSAEGLFRRSQPRPQVTRTVLAPAGWPTFIVIE